MSWAEVENGSVDLEENPDPEEDSDLPQRQHQSDGELGFRGEEEDPEEDLAMSQEVLGNGDALSIPTEEANAQLLDTGSSNLNVFSTVSDGRCNSQNRALSTAHHNGLEGAAVLQNPSIISNDVSDEDSFEQDDELAAPECENNVRQDASSESDRQLLEMKEIRPDQRYSDSQHIVSGAVEMHGSEHHDSELEREGHDIASAFVVEPVGLGAGSEQTLESIGTFSGNVEVEHNFDDAPEAEVSILNQDRGACSYEEEDNINLCFHQERSDNSHLNTSVQDSCEQSDVSVVNLNDVKVVNIPRNESSGITNHSSDHDLQAPECDRQADSSPQISIASQQICFTVPTELSPKLNSAPVPHDNNSVGSCFIGDHETDKSNEQVCGDPILDTTECKLNDDEEGLSTCDSYPADGRDTETSHVCETTVKITDTVLTGQGEVHVGHEPSEYSGSCQQDRFSIHSSDNSANSYPNVPVSADPSDNAQIPSAISQNDLQIKVQQTSATSSISMHLSENSLNPAETNQITDSLNAAKLSTPSSVDHQNAHDPYSLATSPNSLATSPNSCMQLLSSVSQNTTSMAPQHSSPTKVVPQTIAADSSLERQLALVLQSDDEDELLHELDAELLAHVSRTKSPQRNCNHLSKTLDTDIEQTANGLQLLLDFKQMQEHNRQLLEQLRIRDEEIRRLSLERDSAKESLNQVHSQAEEQQKIHMQKADEVYSPQIKKLESTVAQQQDEMKVLKDKLVSHDSAARKAVTTLQNELKSRVDQITKMYEECLKEKDMMVVKFAESEAKQMEAKQTTDRMETKLKEALKEKDSMSNALKAAKSDKLKAVSNFEMKCAEASNLQKELEKLKEAINSTEYRIKWFQNKLKDELENHKETKANLEKTTTKLKEAREETEIIRKECQSIVKRYQESEEIKSKSLDKELKLKETELRTQLQERNYTEEIHQMMKRELESLKSQHKDLVQEMKTYKDKVQCLEEERRQNHQMIENYQEIMQRQKAENADLKNKIASLANLEEDFKRAQEMIQALDKDISELKIVNRDLQKEMESCRDRESKMLTLQSELSCTNAVLRSENTNLSNTASMLTGEVEKLKMEIQELETTVKDLDDKYKEEKARRIEGAENLETSLAEKTKECNDFKQKWEDEIDNSKTLKRRHANNVKDLTRQLQQLRKRIDTLEGKGDVGSMGSRTNSNGSLNSIENSSQQSGPVHQPQLQEFPVITEQVEFDKQVLIERIVRLQKSHARKSEKLEFLGEHIQQLLEEIRKKNKVIQSYALREESGTLSSEDMDANKTLLARKGGIMASLYSVHQQDGSMTLELSLQINHKLQAVLEDTLLKNITLKESLDTLGEEIARLSQENRQLQLSMQQV
ncbi:hypothetical protein BsWGS_00595 [Bradybaena similaris]